MSVVSSHFGNPIHTSAVINRKPRQIRYQSFFRDKKIPMTIMNCLPFKKESKNCPGHHSNSPYLHLKSKTCVSKII